MTRDPKRLGAVVAALIPYRGWSSAKELDASYDPEAAPVSYGTIYRLIKATPDAVPEKGQKLYQLADMLRLPRMTLRHVYDGNTEAIERLEFEGEDGEETRQFILDLMFSNSQGKIKKRASG